MSSLVFNWRVHESSRPYGVAITPWPYDVIVDYIETVGWWRGPHSTKDTSYSNPDTSAGPSSAYSYGSGLNASTLGRSTEIAFNSNPRLPQQPSYQTSGQSSRSTARCLSDLKFDSKALMKGLSNGFMGSKARDMEPATDSDASNMENAMVKYIPGRTDRWTDFAAAVTYQSPLYQMVRDTLVLIRMIPYIPWIFLPLRTEDSRNELYPSFSNIVAKSLITIASLIELVVLLALPIVLILPGGLTIAGALLLTLLIWLIMRPTQGPKVIMSHTKSIGGSEIRGRTIGGALGQSQLFKNERWLFLNGIMTEHRDLQENINAISEVFGRPILGIHNQSYGFIADLLECIVQRAFNYPTQDGRVAYEAVRANLGDSEVTKVVIIAHSQGGIEASLVLDRLFTELPQGLMAKLEVYTFGSAANHFNDPISSMLRPALSFRVNSTEGNPIVRTSLNRSINYIEHYANEYDMVPRWGVLYSASRLSARHYYGNVFVRLGASGHLFNQHYLTAMFPLDAQEANEFLDQRVEVETDSRRQREAEAERKALIARSRTGLNGRSSPDSHGLKALWLERWGIQLGNGGLLKGPFGKGIGEVGFLDEGSSATQAKGKTVRDLTRLWMYANGGSPDD